jgi:hypothetical protein
MTQDDIIRMAREAGLQQRHATPTEWWCWEGSIERFAALVAAAEREKLAHWMRNLGYATGHGDTMEEMLDHLGTQIAEGLLTEREACAKVCEDTTAAWTQPVYNGACMDCAAAIRARSKT